VTELLNPRPWDGAAALDLIQWLRKFDDHIPVVLITQTMKARYLDAYASLRISA